MIIYIIIIIIVIIIISSSSSSSSIVIIIIIINVIVIWGRTFTAPQLRFIHIQQLFRMQHIFVELDAVILVGGCV